MKKLLFISLLIFGCIESLVGIDFYISPGCQIGINNSKKMFHSYQVISGLIYESGMPAITIGRRHYKINSKKWNSCNYIDVNLQLNMLGQGQV